jgi:hypothetical protein
MADNKKTAEQLQQELIDTQKELLETRPAAKPVAKPYTRDEVKELQSKGHIIGVTTQKLTEGHDGEDLQVWDLWLCTMELKNVHIAEIGQNWSVPVSITPMKIERPGKMGNDKTFQWENKAINFRERSKDKQIFFNFPKGAVVSGTTYDCTYWPETTGRGDNEKTLIHALVKECPRATGAPAKK